MATAAFPLMSDFRRRTVRAPVNPMDKSTVISVYPRRIEERKVTIDPGLFIIEPGTPEKPSTLVVGPSSWWKEIDETQPLLEISHSSVVVAQSVVRDYINGLIACDMGENMPGLFFLPGVWTAEKIAKDATEEGVEARTLLAEAVRKQKNWFNSLVTMADALWSRSNGNPIVIDDHMKMAANLLGLSTKDWMKNTIAFEMIRCKACGSLRNPQYPICPTCKSIDDPVKAKDLNLRFAQ